VRIDSLQDDKEEESVFTFDRVFYEDSIQADVFEFVAKPIVKGRYYTDHPCTVVEKECRQMLRISCIAFATKALIYQLSIRR
jgi:hypothetical protein